MTHAIPSECPKCGSMFLEHQRAGSVLRTCMGPSCTMAQWVVAGIAKGTVADHDTRRWRATAHFEIDTLWSEGLLTLQEAYSRIAEKMGVTELNVGALDADQCRLCIDVAMEVFDSATREQRKLA